MSRCRRVIVPIATVVGLLAVTACSDEVTAPVGTVATTPPSTIVVVTSTVEASTSTTSSTVPATTTLTTTTTTTPAMPTTASTIATTTSTVAPTVAPTAAPTTAAPVTTISGGRSTAVDRLPTDQRVIALTFDAGSDLGNLGLVLDTLSEKGVVASFGITGEFAEAHPDHVRRIAREGHAVINHSYAHWSFTGVSSSDVLLTTQARQEDLLDADSVLASLTGASTVPFWRPPFGDYDASVLDDVGAIGYAYTVMWTFDSLGWRGLSTSEIVSRVLDLAEPGAIVVMHVGSQSADGPALAEVIDRLRADGYAFTSIAYALGAR